MNCLSAERYLLLRHDALPQHGAPEEAASRGVATLMSFTIRSDGVLPSLSTWRGMVPGGPAVCCSGGCAVASSSRMGIACSWSCCIDGFHRSSRPSQSSDRRLLCAGIGPASGDIGDGNPAALEADRKSTRTYAR